jgi:Domain of unknown function (DUF4153)
MSIATTSDFGSAPARPLVTPFLLAAACVALADWLFYGYDQIGISLALFFAVLGVVAVAANGVHAPRPTQIVMTAIFAAGLVALVEDVSFLSVIWAGLATAMFVVVVSARDEASWRRQLFEAVTTPFRGPFQLAIDAFRVLDRLKAQTPEWLRVSSLIAWIVPLGAFAIFLALFASANPLIESPLLKIDFAALFRHIDLSRMLFWAFVTCAIWPLMLRRVWRRPARKPAAPAAETAGTGGDLFGVRAMSRSLVLFNALFALQTTLDLLYLWGGAKLPDGMSYASYAHRGAYPLIVTALLAAGFVLIAMRPGGPAQQSRLIRPLVLAWIGQNILLVISAMLRLDIYVAFYSLTYMRLAAFIWMLLVAAGLLLILIQIKLGKPNSWLLAANAITLATVLYGCCFLNAPRLIASYNIEHSREIGGSGPYLDFNYLASLGFQALPPLEARLKEVPAWSFQLSSRAWLNRDRFRHPGNWREWGFRTWRLERYLANNPYEPPQPLLNGDRG